VCACAFVPLNPSQLTNPVIYLFITVCVIESVAERRCLRLVEMLGYLIDDQ